MRLCNLRHAVAEILVAEFADDVRAPVAAGDDDRGVRHAVEHRGLDHRIVDHIFEDDALADFQFVVEGPVAAVVAGKAARAAHAPAFLPFGGFVRPDDGRFIGHFEAVGHMAGERHVEHRRMHAGIFDDVLDRRDEAARPPGEGAARFEDQPQAGMAGLEIAQQGDQLVAVVFGVGHQVPAAHVEPPDPVEVLPEMLFDGFQRQLQVVRARLAQHVEVQPVDPGGKIVQFIGRNAEARAGDTRVIKVGLHGRILRVDAQAARNAAQQRHRPEALELRDRVEGDMVAATEYLVDIAVGIDGSVGVRRLAVLLEYKLRFGGGTRRGTVGMACQLGENAPHGAGLQGYDNFGA